MAKREKDEEVWIPSRLISSLINTLVGYERLRGSKRELPTYVMRTKRMSDS